MRRRSALFQLFTTATLTLVAGCGPRKLVRLKTKTGCPWCSPNQQVQVGERSMGKSFYGDIWREFWVDDNGQEYDPIEVGKQVWQYLEKIGYTRTIDLATRQGQGCAQMRIVSVNPVIVVLYPSEFQRLGGKGKNLSMGTRHPLELAWTSDAHPEFGAPMQWLSPDFKVGPTDIQFSGAGVAEIPLKIGKLKLVRDGDLCRIVRE